MFITIYENCWRNDIDVERNNIAKINMNNTAVLITVQPTVFIPEVWNFWWRNAELIQS
jgi:hypothetical protein